MTKDVKVLVYHFRHNGSPAIKNGLAVITQSQLSDILADNPDLQSSRKSISRGATAVDVHQRDLLTESQAVDRKDHPNLEQEVAGVKMPFNVWLGSAFAGKHSEMVILSKKVKEALRLGSCEQDTLRQAACDTR